ncbi:DUF4258 domain-containing protein [Candidatus Oscillochloris fontis]|uniref:DUF4258 domain-containing protein n=1 Tax=Candidatus Oscillochloris fontis TaxID=2496868 RepID=UPI00101C05F4
MIPEIQEKIRHNVYEFSEHALTQSILRAITLQDLHEAIATAEIIEDYPLDKYGPSVLLLGFTRNQRPIHIHCSYPSRPLIKIITLYEPDSQRWKNNRIRRKTK